MTNAVWHPGFGQELKFDAQPLSDNPAEQVGETISLMAKYVREDAGTPELRRDLEEALALRPDLDAIDATYWYVKQKLGFLRDEDQARPLAGYVNGDVIAVLIRPVDMSELCRDGKCRRTGDCDDYSMYAAALLRTAGVDVKFATVKADPFQPDRDSHVYVVAYCKRRGRMPLDVSHGLYPGWEVDARERTEWGIGVSPLWIVAAAALVAYLVFGRRRKT